MNETKSLYSYSINRCGCIGFHQSGQVKDWIKNWERGLRDDGIFS